MHFHIIDYTLGCPDVDIVQLTATLTIACEERDEALRIATYRIQDTFKHSDGFYLISMAVREPAARLSAF